MPGYSNKSLDFVRRHPLATVLTTIFLTAGGAHFMLRDSTNNRTILDCSGSGCIVSVPLLVNGVNAGSGATTRSVTLLIGTGGTISVGTGTNVIGDLYIDSNFTIANVGAHLTTAASNNLTTFIIKKNGKAVTSTHITIDASETDSSTALTAPVINAASGSFVVGDILTIDINSPATVRGTDGSVRFRAKNITYPNP